MGRLPRAPSQRSGSVMATPGWILGVSVAALEVGSVMPAESVMTPRMANVGLGGLSRDIAVDRAHPVLATATTPR